MLNHCYPCQHKPLVISSSQVRQFVVELNSLLTASFYLTQVQPHFSRSETLVMRNEYFFLKCRTSNQTNQTYSTSSKWLTTTSVVEQPIRCCQETSHPSRGTGPRRGVRRKPLLMVQLRCPWMNSILPNLSSFETPFKYEETPDILLIS